MAWVGPCRRNLSVIGVALLAGSALGIWTGRSCRSRRLLKSGAVHLNGTNTQLDGTDDNGCTSTVLGRHHDDNVDNVVGGSLLQSILETKQQIPGKDGEIFSYLLYYREILILASENRLSTFKSSPPCVGTIEMLFWVTCSISANWANVYLIAFVTNIVMFWTLACFYTFATGVPAALRAGNNTFRTKCGDFFIVLFIADCDSWMVFANFEFPVSIMIASKAGSFVIAFLVLTLAAIRFLAYSAIVSAVTAYIFVAIDAFLSTASAHLITALQTFFRTRFAGTISMAIT